jgi:Ser/Thr protein kinase RdoA (MazF antagonist)
MNQSALLAFLQETYLLPALHAATPVAVGYLSQNWVISAGNERYFLKQYRFDDVTRVAAAHAALSHFHGAGLPAILPLPTRDGRWISTTGDRHYTLFPFVTGQQLRRGALPVVAIQSMGTMLARLHRAGHNVQLPQLRQWRLKADRSLFVADASAILDRIVRQPTLTPFDLLAEQTVRRQLALVEQTPLDLAVSALQPDHLIHGDYHDSNLFFNEAGEVAYLFDWEKAEIAPREVELVRALLFTCFSNPDNFRGTFLPHNFEQAALFLSAYHAQYPIASERFIEALRARYWGSLCSLWVVTEHYLYQNTRVDPFLESTLAEVSYFADHLPQMIDWFHSLVSRQFMP